MILVTSSNLLPKCILDYMYPFTKIIYISDFPGGSDGEESACNAGDTGIIHGSGRSPGKGNSNPLQYYCLENSMDRETWWVTVNRVTKELDMTE